VNGQRLIENTYTPMRHPWPDDVEVQGSDHSVVFRGDTPSYRTAFVEAFPDGTFLRGEGETLADAEDICWEKYQRHIGCEHGPFERRHYRNGAGYCVKCGTWMSQIFEPLPEDPDRPPTMLERLFRDQDLDTAATVIDAVARSGELPTKSEKKSGADE
jgi:hypothetical protein